MDLQNRFDLNQLSVNEERERKKQKRMENNRRSARRSRSRKQAELEGLRQKVKFLTNENSTLQNELDKLSEEHQNLSSDYNTIKDWVTNVCAANASSQRVREGD